MMPFEVAAPLVILGIPVVGFAYIVIATPRYLSKLHPPRQSQTTSTAPQSGSTPRT